MKHLPLACLFLGLLARAARAESLKEQVDRATERGVQALRAMYDKGGGPLIGRAGDGYYDMGRTALVGLTLLECGATADDPLIRRIADKVRDQCVDSNRVYNLTLAILLFDKLGDDRDVPLIQAMAVRLMEGQFKGGGWIYTTPGPDDKEVQRLKSVIQKRAELRTGDASGRSRKSGEPPLDPDLAERLKRLGERGLGEHEAKLQNNPLANLTGVVDNSNTQFAIMGLWAARYHGIPADGSLRLCEAYFRASHDRGTWTYSNGMEPYGRNAMTCAGLMGLAIGAGVLRDHQMKVAPDAKGKPPALKDPLMDPVVQAALNFVGGQLAKMVADGLQRVQLDYYFIWSVERVGVTYSLTTMGGHKWYDLGATILVLHQLPDGTWTNNHGAMVDTCFALMFLKRANLTRDLSSVLAKKPSQPSLRADDSGKSSALEPKAARPGDADRLRRELLTSAPPRQAQILEQMRDGDGSEYTEALVTVITDLKGETRNKARDSLAERLVRMTPATVRDKLKDGRPEMRRAAALACAMKEDKSFLPDLIAVLDDADAIVVRAAGVALRSLTGESFGPSANATADERAKAVAAWKSWWRLQKSK
jgi:hypothetical protein